VSTEQEPDEDDKDSREKRAEDLTDELARKYDPERLLKIMSKRAGRGDALEHSVRQKYEKRFGVDLGHVRVYTGEFAEEFNRQRNAYAVTVGATGMILMGNSPEKSLGSASGQALLAHELTHVAQQARGGLRGLHRKATFDSGMPFAEEHEHEADLVEHAVHEEELGGGIGKPAQDSREAAMMGEARREAQAKMKETIERIKARVIELVGDAARAQMMRNGYVRRA
jgi:hypothetical protein